MTSHYNTIEKASCAEYKDRGSRFLGYAFPVANAEEFKKRMKALKEEHAKAGHFCFAYRIGTDRNNFRSSDDGEPAGSAGKPILGQIDSKNLSDTAIVVVRYFGGTLLGVPGLITAYKTTASFALQLAQIVRKHVLHKYLLHFDYTLMNDVMMTMRRYECVVLKQELQLFCSMEVGVPDEFRIACVERLSAMQGVEVGGKE